LFKNNNATQPDISLLKSYQKKFMLIQSFNTCTLNLHFEDIIMDPNLSSSHILCSKETKIQNITIHKKFTKQY
jgi:hypothetical protein